MSWQEAHRRSESFAAEAEALRVADRDRAGRLYAQAAAAEGEALRNVPSDLPRTRAILAVSYAALLFKSGAMTETRTVLDGLDGEAWPAWAQRELKAIRAALEKHERSDRFGAIVDKVKKKTRVGRSPSTKPERRKTRPEQSLALKKKPA